MYLDTFRSIYAQLCPHTTNNLQIHTHQHVFKTKHFSITAVQTINTTITTGFNKKKSHERIISIALDMSKAFDTVHLHKFLHKSTQANLPNIVIKFLSNYIRGRKQFTLNNNTKSKQASIKTGVLHGGVPSPTLFSIYTSGIPTPPKNRIKLITYAYDITIFSTHTNINAAKQQVHPYLLDILNWIKQNLILNPSITQTMLFAQHPAEHSTKLRLTVKNATLHMDKNIKMLGLTFDPRHIFAKRNRQSEEHHKKLKALTTRHYGNPKKH